MDSNHKNTCPMTADQVLSEYFMEHRAKLLDVAAFLDRLDRAGGAPSEDFRYDAFVDALRILVDGNGSRAARMLDLLSDPTQDPLESAAGLKGAHGAWPGYGKEVSA